jgi:hypothetical protein
LAEFRFLEHGAFYSILALSVIMFAQSVAHIPKVITGLIGPGLIGLALRRRSGTTGRSRTAEMADTPYISRRALWLNRLSDEVVRSVSDRIRSGELSRDGQLPDRDALAAEFVTSRA